MMSVHHFQRMWEGARLLRVGSRGFCSCIWATVLRSMTSVTSPGETLASADPVTSPVSCSAVRAPYLAHEVSFVHRTESCMQRPDERRGCSVQLWGHLQDEQIIRMAVCANSCFSVERPQKPSGRIYAYHK
ncbi:hypothetical protein EYF80_008253 [Liparis tanakae]|uniref:Uncharacterized protein n=1 Tax=Liparis tanakae TaxID=230148 RepID=A0A4Z2IUJ2_9TELE|nr:hypothetical protein EYF80_008253 [Liparis tanakae]